MFALPAAGVAAIPGRGEAAVRQSAHRARGHVRARRPRFDAGRSAQRVVTERFLAACAGGDVDALLTALAPDVVLVTDGGGRAKAALRPIVGAAEVARFLLATAAEGLSIPGVRIEVTDVDGALGVVAWVRGAPCVAMSLVVADRLVDQVLVARNPEEPAGVRRGGALLQGPAASRCTRVSSLGWVG